MVKVPQKRRFVEEIELRNDVKVLEVCVNMTFEE